MRNFLNKRLAQWMENIDPFESYRSLFNGSVAANANPELIFTLVQGIKVARIP